MKIAVGHSYGGATAIHSAKTDKRIKTCFVLDGWIKPSSKANYTIRSCKNLSYLLGDLVGKSQTILTIITLLKELFSNSPDFSL